MHIYKISFPKHNIVRCGIPISVSLHVLYCSCNNQHESLQVRVRVYLIKSAVGPARTRWRTRVELMNYVLLHIKEAVIFLKLSHIINLALSSHFLELLLEFFLLPIMRGRMWAKNWRTNVTL
jgi:hypothetical protein